MFTEAAVLNNVIYELSFAVVNIGTGKTVAGFVKEVGNHLIHLEKLDGKDFFDALIRITGYMSVPLFHS